MALANDASVRDGEIVGDPTEAALVVLAAKGGLDVDETRRLHPRLAEVPFDSEYKFMATFHELEEAGPKVVRCFVKGAPDVLLARSTSIRDADGSTVSAASAATTNDASSVQTPTTRFADAYHASMSVSATVPAGVPCTRWPSGKPTTLDDPVGLIPTTACRTMVGLSPTGVDPHAG